jgi:hypothetical protein
MTASSRSGTRIDDSRTRPDVIHQQWDVATNSVFDTDHKADMQLVVLRKHSPNIFDRDRDRDHDRDSDHDHDRDRDVVSFNTGPISSHTVTVQGMLLPGRGLGTEIQAPPANKALKLEQDITSPRRSTGTEIVPRADIQNQSANNVMMLEQEIIPGRSLSPRTDIQIESAMNALVLEQQEIVPTEFT